MDDQSDEEMPVYKSNRYQKKNESSESPLSISDEEDTDVLLEIKPPQAKIFKHSHYRHDKHSSSSSRQVYISSSSHHHKSHHSRRHQEERYFKDRFDDEFKMSRPTHTKDYETERMKEYDEYRRKKQSSHSHRYKEQDLREKIERRKLHHQKEYDRKEKDRKEKDREFYRKETSEKRKRHHHESNRRRDKTPERSECMRHDKDKASLVSISEDSFSPMEKEMVVEIEVSPPVLKSQYSERSEEEDLEKEELVREEEEEGEANSDESSSESTSSSDSSSDTNSDESSSEKAEEEEDEEDEKESENEAKVETSHESNETSKEETPPRVVTTNDDVDSEIELEKDTLPLYFPAIQGCRSVEEFRCLNRIEEGTYGIVYRAREKRTEKIVALKRLKMEKEKEGFPITSLREINTLLKAQHPNIVTVKEIVVGSNMDKIFIVMDYVEHDLKSLMETMKEKNSIFTIGEVKCLMLQLLQAVSHLHDNWILHRDLKTSNLLFSNSGVLKVGDFGLAREYGSPLKPYTSVVVTLWYRAPELLLGTKEYSTSIDIWSVGCIFAEFLRMEPLFPGKTAIDQLNRIFKMLGTPNERDWPDYPKFPVVQRVNFTQYPPNNNIRSEFKLLSDVGYDLFKSFLLYDTKKRITAEAALKHKYFSEKPEAVDPCMFSKWPAKSDPGSRKAVDSSPKPPSGGAGYKELGEDDGFYIGVGERNSRGVNVLGSTFNLKF